MELLDLAQKVSGAGLATLLVIILETGRRGMWVYKHVVDYERSIKDKQIEQLMRERDAWQRIALASTTTADKAVEHAALVQRSA